MARKPNNQAPETPADASVVLHAPETDRPIDGAQAGGHEPPPAASGSPAPPDDPLTLTIIGPARGRWRAGRHFGPEPVAVPVAELTEDQIAAIQADPELSTVVA